jgi:hypothetical protein
MVHRHGRRPTIVLLGLLLADAALPPGTGNAQYRGGTIKIVF